MSEQAVYSHSTGDVPLKNLELPLGRSALAHPR
jgi:hypothetical protein